KSVEQLLVDVGVEGGIVLNQISRRLDSDRGGAAGHRQTELGSDGYHRPDFHVLRILSESRSRHRHVIRIKRHVREIEIPLTVCGGRSVIAADRLMNLNLRIRNHRARRVQDGTVNRSRTSARLRVSVKAQCKTENHDKSRMKRLFARSQHEFLQKKLVRVKIKDTVHGTRTGRCTAEI